MWTRKGDFSRRLQFGLNLVRHCEYINASAGSIASVSIAYYNDGDYQIRFRASNKENFRHLSQNLILADFPAPSGLDSLTDELVLVTSNKQLIANFINVFKQNTKELSEIESELCASLGVDLGRSTAMPNWLQEHDFTRRLERSFQPMTRTVHYRTGNSRSLVSEFHLYGYVDDEFMFKFNLSDNSAQFRELLIATGAPLIFCGNGEVILRFNALSIGNFERTIGALSSISPQFSEIADSFKQQVIPVISVTRPSESTVLSRESASAASGVENNQTKLDYIGFSEENLTEEEKEHYSQYCCGISKSIMTEPVYDPRFPQYQFEKAEILRWLAIKSEHPYTRARLTAAELTPNLPLKEKIEAFVNSQRSVATKKAMLNDRIDSTILHYEQRKKTALDPQVREELKAHASDVMRLVAADITLDDLLKLNSSVRKIVNECSSRVVELVERGVNLSRLNDMHIDDVSILLKMTKSDDANTILTSLLDKKPRSIG